MRAAYSSARGFTLLELLVGAAVGSFISLAAVSFVVHQTEALGATSELIEISESSRFGLDRLASDLRMAGVGIGYGESGDFAGLATGNFTVGTASFVSDNRTLASGKLTDDVGIRVALGGRTTIARYDDSGIAEICKNSTFRVGERVMLGSEDGLTGRSVSVATLAPTTCMGDDCVSGCDLITFTADNTFVAGPSALTAHYAGGTASGDLHWVTWFIDDSESDGIPRLRRAEGPCVARNSSCGEVVAENVETLQIRRWAFINDAWVDVTTRTVPTTEGERLRVDLELVVRAAHSGGGTSEIVRSELDSNLCFPACSGAPDGVVRRRVATSVEIKNSGRGSYRRQR